MKSHVHPLFKSITYAFSGIKEAFIEEPNLRIHVLVATITVLLGLSLKLSEIEWVVIVLTISFVIILELLNTSLEAVTDFLSPKIHPKAKLAKDVAAGAVLLSAVSAIIIGVIIFLPKVLLVASHLLF